jgi:hypothetical protein
MERQRKESGEFFTVCKPPARCVAYGQRNTSSQMAPSAGKEIRHSRRELAWSVREYIINNQEGRGMKWMGKGGETSGTNWREGGREGGRTQIHGTGGFEGGSGERGDTHNTVDRMKEVGRDITTQQTG